MNEKQYCTPQHTGGDEVVCSKCGRPCSFAPGEHTPCSGRVSRQRPEEILQFTSRKEMLSCWRYILQFSELPSVNRL